MKRISKLEDSPIVEPSYSQQAESDCDQENENLKTVKYTKTKPRDCT